MIPESYADKMYSSLVELGYSGATLDMFYEFLGDQGYTGSLPDRIFAWMGDNGYTDYTLNDWADALDAGTLLSSYNIWLQLQTSLTALYGTAPIVDKSATTYVPACSGNDPDAVLLVAVAPDTPHVISEQAAAGYAPRFDTGVFYDTLLDGTLLHPKDADGTYLRYSPWASDVAVTAGDYCHYLGSYYLATADDAVNTDTPDVASNWVEQGYYRGPFVVATEPAATNLLARSEDVSAAPWASIGTATAPDATTINLPAIGDYRYQGFTAALALGEKITANCVLSGSGAVTLRFTAGGAENSRINLTGTPTKYTFTHTAVSADSGPLEFFIGRVDAGDTATAVTATRLMVEKGGVATSYIPTAATTITRPASRILTTGTDYPSNDGSVELTIYPKETGREQWALQNSAGTQGLYVGSTNKVCWLGSDFLTELLINGTNPVDTTGWTPKGGSILAADGTKFILTSDGTNNYAYQAVTTVVGKKYRVKGTCKAGTVTANFRAGTSVAGTQYFNTQDAVGVGATTDQIITATATTMYISIANQVATDGLVAYYYNMSVVELSELTSTTSVAAGTPITAKVVMDSVDGTSLLINGVEEDSDATMTGGWTPGAAPSVGSDQAKAYTLNGGVSLVRSPR